ncbi:hypothetical protein M8C21_029601 [Ambrosia artemisiifolia]|uniref:Uncharacterized protein n=1 Tax=Ambrosia artemisiifolia TaxID=4212 RepID=A0AAD5CRW4_AMBAR|nr:hypothetical protein M8C21_029601 [Ambrosia artemisiifolia]
MAGNGLSNPNLGRVKLTDLIASEGVPSDTYKLSVSTLLQSLAQYSAAIVQFLPNDAALLRCCLESARPYFNQKPSHPSADVIHINDSREWCKTSGYSADPQMWQESYDYRPGMTPTELNNDVESPLLDWLIYLSYLEKHDVVVVLICTCAFLLRQLDHVARSRCCE